MSTPEPVRTPEWYDALEAHARALEEALGRMYGRTTLSLNASSALTRLREHLHPAAPRDPADQSGDPADATSPAPETLASPAEAPTPETPPAAS